MSITTTDLDVRPTVGRHPATRRHLALVPASISDEERVLRWGRSSVSPFTLGPDREVIHLPCTGVTGIVVRGGHAVMATDPVTPPGAKALGVSELLDTLALRGLAPVFAAVVGPEHYRRLGLFAWPIAEDAVIDLRTFSLAGSRRASIRHSVSSAGRSGLRTAAWSDQFAVGWRPSAAARCASRWADSNRTSSVAPIAASRSTATVGSSASSLGTASTTDVAECSISCAAPPMRPTRRWTC